MLKALPCSIRTKYHLKLALPPPSTKTFLTATKALAARRKPQVAAAARVEHPLTEREDDPAAPTSSSRNPTLRFRGALKRVINSCEDQSKHLDLVQTIVDRYASKSREPHVLYDIAACSFMKRSNFPAAFTLYERMISNGFIPPSTLEAQFLIAGISYEKGKRKEELIASLKRVVGTMGFKPNQLLITLRFMAKFGLPHQLFYDIITLYHSRHYLNDYLNKDGIALSLEIYEERVRLATVEGDIPQVFQALGALPRSGIDKRYHPAIYASFLNALRYTKDPDRNAARAAVDLMETQEIPASLSVWNALIALEYHTHSLHRPFAIYNALKTRQELLPNNSTFIPLYSALNHYWNPDRRRVRHGQPLPDDNDIPSPRQLYRDVLEAQAHPRDPEDPPFFISTNLLNAALRTFVFKKDYAAAYVLLGAPSNLGVRIDVKTYLIVFRHLLNRITSGIRSPRKVGQVVKWADRFLGLPHPISDPRFLSELQLSNALANHLLELSSRPKFDLTWSLYIHPGQPAFDGPPREARKYTTPTVDQMLGNEPIQADLELSPYPLRRLVTKALIAELDSEVYVGNSAAYKEAITKARHEMLPKAWRRRESTLPSDEVSP